MSNQGTPNGAHRSGHASILGIEPLSSHSGSSSSVGLCAGGNLHEEDASESLVTSGSCFFSLAPTKKSKEDNDDDDVDAVVAREMNALSVDERERMVEEIHGLPDLIDESEKFLNVKLSEMQQQLDLIPYKQKSAFMRAQFLSPAFTQDRKLRLMILRAEQYRTAQAARRLTNHFEFKLQLFGIERLVKDITQDDLSPDMKEELRAGNLQLSPVKDRSGRSVLFYQRNNGNTDWRRMLGMSWYVHNMAVQDDEDAQRRGVVTIVHDIGPMHIFKPEHFTIVSKSAQSQEAGTVRSAGYHYCYNLPMFRQPLNYFQSKISRDARLRLRPHFGSFTECIYQLLGYGITPDVIPTDHEGNLQVDAWHRRLDEIQAHERIYDAEIARSVILPTPRDIALGRGRPFQSHPGTVFLAAMVERNRQLYAEARRSQKSTFILAVVTYLTRVRGGRFLKRDDSNLYWVEVDDDYARKKVSHAFRRPIRAGVLEREPPSRLLEVPGADGIKIAIPSYDEHAIQEEQ